jgi:predicted GNAT family acetyltransferase
MNVEHDEPNHRFVSRQPNGSGELVYLLPREGVIDLHHTDVDPALQGQGIAAALAEAAFEYARAHGKKVMVTCPYVKSWLQRHPEHQDMVVSQAEGP